MEAVLPTCQTLVTDVVGHFNVTTAGTVKNIRLHLSSSHMNCAVEKCNPKNNTNYMPAVHKIWVRQRLPDGRAGAKQQLTLQQIMDAVDGERLVGYLSV